jgi:hypothetical protein
LQAQVYAGIIPSCYLWLMLKLPSQTDGGSISDDIPGFLYCTAGTHPETPAAYGPSMFGVEPIRDMPVET